MSVLLRLRERGYKTEQSVGRKCGCGEDLAKQAPRKHCASDQHAMRQMSQAGGFDLQYNNTTAAKMKQRCFSRRYGGLKLFSQKGQMGKRRGEEGRGKKRGVS